MDDVQIDSFEFSPMEEHVQRAADLFDAYSTVIPLDGWASTDLVALSNWIDVELQERGELEAPAHDSP
jgi:hypothetical protein